MERREWPEGCLGDDAGAPRKGYDWNKRCEAATVTGSLGPTVWSPPAHIAGPALSPVPLGIVSGLISRGGPFIAGWARFTRLGDVLFSANFACRGFSEVRVFALRCPLRVPCDPHPIGLEINGAFARCPGRGAGLQLLQCRDAPDR